MNGIIYFTASWCVPCKKTKPIVEKLNERYGGIFAVTDVDSQAELVEQYGIQSVPTFVLIKYGVEIERYVGGKTEPELLDMVNKVL